MNTQELSKVCRQVRRDIITMTANAGSGHPGGSLSAVELMTSVFFNHMRVDPSNPHDPDRDRFVLSKGHAAPCYYAVLAAKGFISRDEYANFRQLHSILQGHPDAKKVPGVDASTGSLGQGVSIAVGMALGAKHLGKDTKVFALVGENGAGKTTLMNILYGIHEPTNGEVYIRGRKVERFSPKTAISMGVGMVHQHFMLVPSFTVAQNIVMSREPRRLGVLFDNKAAEAAAQKLVEEYGLVVDPAAVVREIGVGLQQRVEILKTLYRGADILILDEPTAVLTPQEIDELMQIMRNLAAEGKSILFISHKLAEIMAVADRCSVLRKGKYIGTVETANTTMEELSAMMVGRNVSFHVDKKPAEPGEVVLEVEGMTMASKLHKNNAVKNVSLKVRRGEIVCLAGIDGNGQTEFVYGLTGLEPLVSGSVKLCGKDITHASIRQRSVMGMSHIPEDRHKHGLVLDYSLEDNMVLQRYFEPEFTDKAGFLRRRNIRTYAEKLIDQYDVRSGQGPITIARSMSGGNQQKAIVAREIDKDPELLVAVQPTRGLDVGAIEYIHRQLVAQRDEGKAVLLVSLELDEVMDVPDRILVMYEGEIVGELDPKKTTQEELGLYMAGAKRDEVKA